MKSWKTTTLGVASAIVAIAQAVIASLDSDAATVPNWELTVTTVLTAIGLLFARDNDKSSEDVGAKQQSWGQRPLPLVLIPLLLVGATGCTTDTHFTVAAEHYHRTVGERWSRYVQSDPVLTDEQKQVRLEAHEHFRQAIEARKQLEGR